MRATPTRIDAGREGVYRWSGGRFERVTGTGASDCAITAADSWVVDEGRVLALDLHRLRFAEAVGAGGSASGLLDFWDAVVGSLPSSGTWFPRVELQRRSGPDALIYRHRVAPVRRRSTVLATAPGPDPRTSPHVKGPDLDAMSRLRAAVEPLGADEAVICSPDGRVVEGAYSGLLWWRGDTLVAPSPELERVDSVTVRSVLAVARALGTDVAYESVTPAELDGLEIWACSALHGIRIATGWIDGPRPAELPGRLAAWRRRLGALSRPVDTLDR